MPSKVESISLEIIRLIFERLTLEEKAIASRTCKRWRRMVISFHHWWFKSTILVKRLQSVEQASRIFNFFKDFPTISVKVFIINPLDSQEVSVAWLTTDSLSRCRQISARQISEQGQTSAQALIGNERILSSISIAAQLYPPGDKFSRAIAFRASDPAKAGLMITTRLAGKASSRYVFDRIYAAPRSSNTWALDLSKIQLENQSQAGQVVPIPPFERSLPCLFILWLPKILDPAIFAGFESPALRIVYGSPNSIRNLGIRNLHWLTYLKVEISASTELLHLLEALKMTFNLKALVMTGDSDSDCFINVDCILQHLLQVSSEAVQPAWCRYLERFMGDDQALLCDEDLLVQLKSSRENLGMEGQRFHSSGFIHIQSW